MRTEGEGREAASVGVGIFIGCSPFYGFHLLLVFLIGRLLRLNRLKMYVAANVSNPILAPLLLLAELQTGAWLQRQELHRLSLDTLRHTDPWTFGLDLVLGSVVVGAVLGVIGAAATHLTATRGVSDPDFDAIVQGAADRYLLASMTAWEFARGKLRSDPIYRATVCDGLLPSGGTLVDVGCGTGLMLAVLDEAARAAHDGRWPQARRPPPRFDSLVGIELRPRVAATARRILGDAATIVASDARRAVRAARPGPAARAGAPQSAATATRPDPRTVRRAGGDRASAAPEAPATASAVLLFDVLHMLPRADQEALVGRLADTLEPGGVLLLREADAGGGWRFTCVRIGNALKALATFHWRQRFAFRTAAEWQRLLADNGLVVESRPMGEGTPFANVLLRAVKLEERPTTGDHGRQHEGHEGQHEDHKDM